MVNKNIDSRFIWCSKEPNESNIISQMQDLYEEGYTEIDELIQQITILLDIDEDEYADVLYKCATKVINDNE